MEVRVGFYLSDITAIDGEQELCVFEGALTMKWRDARQAFDPAELGIEERIYQGGFQFSEVFDGWWPQMVLSNESGEFTRHGEILRISPDGAMTYIEEVDITAKSPMHMGAFPFDRQTCVATFEVLGFDASEVIVRPDLDTTGSKLEGVSVAEWQFGNLSIDSAAIRKRFSSGNERVYSLFNVRIEMDRQPGFVFRVIVVPLIMLVVLSWSVFWMDRESLGDRMDISFIGILTVVAFQILVSEQLPRIAYFTFMSTFLYINYGLLFATVFMNLVVDWADKSGRKALGDRIDRRCRWAFPVGYFSLIGFAALYHL